MRKILAMIGVLCMVVTLAIPTQAAPITVAGKSALLMDAATGTVLYEHNAHEPLAPA